MIDKENFHVLNFVKKEDYTGSMDGMRYMLKKKSVEDTDRLEVVIWPEPYCYTKTPEESKQRIEFEFTTEGVSQAADYLNEQYEQQKGLWDLVRR